MAGSAQSRSPSLSPSPISSSYSDTSSFDENTNNSELADASAPSTSTGQIAINDSDAATCHWEDCGLLFDHLPSLIEHIHTDHIGVHKSTYTCEWTTCSRRGLPQTSRFALISHIRSHTGEKPFVCPRPECDKSFTRSDALVKHMRLQHQMDPPVPARGGNRKRKRDDTAVESTEPLPPSSQQQQLPPPPPQPSNGFSTFKIDRQHTPSDIHDDGPMSPFEGEYPIDSGGPSTGEPPIPSRTSFSPEEDGLEDDEGIPPHLLQTMDPQTGLIMGRSPDMVRYIIQKAKYRYALQQHEFLIEELRVRRNEERIMREAKETVLDEVLRRSFGQQAAADLLLDPSDVQTRYR